MIARLPEPLRDRVLQILTAGRRLAYLQLDPEGHIAGCGGELPAYGLAGLAPGQLAEEALPLLHGLLPLGEGPLTLRNVGTDAGACVDLYLWPDDTGTWALLLDASEDHAQKQAIQQKGNELSLRSERQARVLDTHLGKSIAGELLEGRWHLRGGGERRQLTILFADLRGFTPFSEREDPETVFRILNDYMPAMLDPIQQHGGTVDKIVGDAVMGVFGLVPTDSAAAVDACRAADTIMSSVGQVNAAHRRGGDPTLEVGIGLATGPVAMGIVGTTDRRGFTVIGHHVNFAARLQSQAQGGEILIDADTRQALGADASGWRELTLSLKGLRKPVRVFGKSQP